MCRYVLLCFAMFMLCFASFLVSISCIAKADTLVHFLIMLVLYLCNAVARTCLLKRLLLSELACLRACLLESLVVLACLKFC